MRSRLAITGSLALVLLALPARGEQPHVQPPEEIIVEAPRLEPQEIFADTPTEIEILSWEEVQLIPANNVADVVRNLPGVRIQSRVQGEEAAVSIEGMPPEYTRVLVNGQRYSGELGAVDDLRDVPLGNVQRIEVLRGAQGLRYGAEAGGGVVNIVTKDPPSEGWSTAFDVRSGSDRGFQTSATGGLDRGPLSMLVSFDHDQINGYDPPSDRGNAVLIPSGEDSRRLSRDVYGLVKLEAHSNLELRTRLGWRREDEDFALSENSGSETSDGSSWRERHRWLGSQELEWNPSSSTRLTSALSWFRSDTDSRVGRPYQMREDEPRLELDWEQILETGPFSHVLTLGTDTRRPHLQLREGPLPAAIENADLGAGDLDERFRSTGVFLLGETQLDDWLSLEFGARAELHSHFDTKIAPQAALLLTPWRRDDGRALKIRASYGRNHRAPSLRDLFQPPAPQLGGAYFLAGNPDLTPEASTSYRIGLELAPVPGLSLSVVAFHNDIEDHIRSSFAGSLTTGTQLVESQVSASSDSGLALICETMNHFFPECAALDDVETVLLEVPINSPLYRKTNLDSVRTRGIEARLHWKASLWLDLQLGYTLLDTRVLDSNVTLTELPNEPRHVIDGHVVLHLPTLDTRLTVRARWRDRALIETSGTGLLSFGSTELSDPSLTVDVRLTQPIGEHLEFYADLYNVTDTRLVDSYVVRGRTFFLGLRTRFH